MSGHKKLQRKSLYLPAGLSRECRVRRRCNVLLGHRRRWGTHAAACVRPGRPPAPATCPAPCPGERTTTLSCTALRPTTGASPPGDREPTTVTALHYCATAIRRPTGTIKRSLRNLCACTPANYDAALHKHFNN